MPDFTEIVQFHCASVEEYSTEVVGSRGKTYTVRVGYAGPRSPTKFAWSCDCPGFKFRKRCKHIDAAKQNYCGWQENIHGEERVRDEEGIARCPKCNDLAIAQRHAV